MMTKLSVNNEETDCEYDSDYGEYSYYSDDENTEFEWDSDYEDYRPEVQSIPVIPEIPYSSFDSTVTSIENATGKAESTSPFFWITASDLMRHCARSCGSDAYEGVQEGIRQFELHKTWKYWLCYFCNEKFIDPDSHMAHLENEHRIPIPRVEYQLIPALASSGKETEIGLDAGKIEQCLEDSITIDETCRYFMVDSTKFHEIPLANEEQKLSEEKCTWFLAIVHDDLSSFRILFDLKRMYLAHLEVVNDFHKMLFEEGEPLELLVAWLYKYSSMEQLLSTTQRFQFQFLSKLLNRAHDNNNGLLSNRSILGAFDDTRREIIYELDRLDAEIMVISPHIVHLKYNLSNLSIIDYRTRIVPSVRSFLLMS